MKLKIHSVVHISGIRAGKKREVKKPFSNPRNEKYNKRRGEREKAKKKTKENVYYRIWRFGFLR